MGIIRNFTVAVGLYRIPIVPAGCHLGLSKAGFSAGVTVYDRAMEEEQDSDDFILGTLRVQWYFRTGKLVGPLGPSYFETL